MWRMTLIQWAIRPTDDKDHPMSPLSVRKAFIAACIFIAICPGHAAPVKVDLTALQRPTVCPVYAKLNAEENSCVIDPAEAAKITDEQLCNRSPQLRFNVVAGGKSACEVVNATADLNADNDKQVNTIAAECQPLAGHAVKRTGGGSKATCEYSTLDAGVSAKGDYVGDCFVIKSAIPGLPASDSRHWIVTEQDDTNAQDPNLTLVPASDWGPSGFQQFFQRILPIVGCSPKTTGIQPVAIPASTLNRHGAIRRGFVYGVLTAPYKYYPGDKSFQAGLPIGPYLGWRLGESGVGGTFVTAFTLGAVKANTTKADPADATKTVVTGQTDLMALSTAIGVVFDITRNPNKSGFKAGILFGKDYVNQAENINYPQNRRRWVAIQIGFDFTDY
jgi:hypothetical protein